MIHQVYATAPVPVQHALTSLAGFRQNRDRYRKTYWQYRSWLAEFDEWSLDRKLSYQERALRNFVRQAAENSRYYAELAKSGHVRVPSDLSQIGDLPILEKETLRTRLNDIATVNSRNAVVARTGGTTGKPITVRYTSDDMQRRMAMLDHFKARAGFEHRSMRRASFTGRQIVPITQKGPPYWRYNHACRQMLFSTLHLNEQTAGAYVDALNRYKPSALDGFPSAIARLANYILRSGVELNFKPVAIFPTSETLTDESRHSIEAAFGGRVLDQYASAEGAPFVTECHAGSMHIELATGVFETLDDGEILVTSFLTEGTPLIRYRIGDSMSMGQRDECSCGMRGPIVKHINGRANDFLLRPDGVRIQHVGHLFKGMGQSLIGAQLVQRTPREVVALLVVDDRTYQSGHRKSFEEAFAATFGPSMTLKLQYVDEIPRENSGKQRLIKNLLPSSSAKGSAD